MWGKDRIGEIMGRETTLGVMLGARERKNRVTLVSGSVGVTDDLGRRAGLAFQ